MLSTIARRSFPKVVSATPKAFAFRAFSGDRYSIPSDAEQQTGRRKEELDAEAAGDVGFNRDPIIPADDAGTKENPILVSVKSRFSFETWQSALWKRSLIFLWFYSLSRFLPVPTSAL